jgi:hypothetical protein
MTLKFFGFGRDRNQATELLAEYFKVCMCAAHIV